MFNQKKKYFKKKLEGVVKMIWDLEFKKFKTLEIREDVRMEYDQIKNKLVMLEEQIAAQKANPTLSKDEIARLDDNKVLLERDLERYLNQIKGMDLDVAGSAATAEMPEGHQGINQQLDSLYELKGMVKEYIKTL